MKNLKIAAAIALLGTGSYAIAAETTGSLDVSATVSASCAVGTSTMAFGTVDSAALAAADQTGTGTINVTCANTHSYTIYLDLDGTNAETAAARVMTHTDATNTLTYALYKDSARTTLLDGVAGISEQGTGTAQATTIYGKINKTSTAVPGDYSDTVNIRVVY